MQIQDNFLALQEQRPVLSFDKAGLISWANQIVSKYKDLSVREEDVQDIKTVMADLNKTVKTIEDVRKAAVQRVSVPIREFESDIKEVVSIILNTRTALDVQIKNFESMEKEKKRVAVQAIIDEVNSSGKWVIQVQEKWLNKTTSIKSIKDELERITAKYEADAEEKARVEKARQERISIIANCVETHNKQYNLSLGIAQFMTQEYIEQDLESMFHAIKKSFDSMTNHSEVQKEVPAPKAVIPSSISGAVIDPVFETWSFTAEFSNDSEAKSLLRQLKSVCTKFEAKRIA